MLTIHSATHWQISYPVTYAYKQTHAHPPGLCLWILQKILYVTPSDLVSFEQRCKETLHQHLKFQVFQDSRICSLKMFLSLNGFQIFQDPGSAPVSSDPLESRALASATYLVKLQQPSALQGLEFCFKGEFFRDLGPQSELWWVNEVSEASANVDVTVGSQIQVITVTAAHNTSASAPTPPPQPTPGHYVPTA